MKKYTLEIQAVLVALVMWLNLYVLFADNIYLQLAGIVILFVGCSYLGKLITKLLRRYHICDRF